MLKSDIQTLVEQEVKPILDHLGFELVELQTVNPGNGLILKLFIDRVEGGITLSECSQLNKDIGQLLDEKNVVEQEYSLEVSSPGLDRSLMEPRDFKRVLEKKIHIFLKERQDGKLELEGKLVKSSEAGIFINSDKGDELFIPFKKIIRAKQVIL